MQEKLDVPVRASETKIENDTGFIVLVRSPIEPDHANSHIERVTKAIKTYIGKLPGYISGALHIRSDGCEFVNYTEWRSESDYDGFIESIREGEGHARVKRDIGYEPEMIRYVYENTVYPKSESGDPAATSGLRVLSRISTTSDSCNNNLEVLSRYFTDQLSSCSGFISASLHLRKDKNEIMAYTKWRSEAEFDSAMSLSEPLENMEMVSERFSCVKVFSPDHCVEFVR